MHYKVMILPTAWEDLKKIEDWYCLRFDPASALKVVDNILRTIERLERFPDMGSMTPDSWLNQRGYRMVICEKHVAIYKKVIDAVYVYHIADTKTDYTKVFHRD